MAKEKHLVNDFFQVRKKLENFVVDSRNLKKSGNSEGTIWLHQSSLNMLSFLMGKNLLSREIILSHLPLHWGLHLQERICSLESKFFLSRVSP